MATKNDGFASQEREDQRRRLYDSGKTDGEIAAVEGCGRATIFDWRKRNRLPRVRASFHWMNRDEDAERFALWKQGLSDAEIARLSNITFNGVCRWRKTRNLKRNAPQSYLRLSAEENKRRCTLYGQGLSDSDMAKILGITALAVHDWRKRRGWPQAGYHASRPMTPEQRAARMLLYQLGYSDRAIALQQGRTTSSIAHWRNRMGLPPHYRILDVSGRRHERADPHKVILRRIKRAIGGYLAQDIADDACSEMMLSIISGKISIDEIEKAARKHGNRVLDQYASKWGARSLDETVAGTEDFTLMDTLVDEGSSSWLEEMGATVW